MVETIIKDIIGSISCQINWWAMWIELYFIYQTGYTGHVILSIQHSDLVKVWVLTQLADHVQVHTLFVYLPLETCPWQLQEMTLV